MRDSVSLVGITSRKTERQEQGAGGPTDSCSRVARRLILSVYVTQHHTAISYYSWLIIYAFICARGGYQGIPKLEIKDQA
eukprot:2517408-Pleurochrysis_carterae.AAC.2